jgi:hypothetical protein
MQHRDSAEWLCAFAWELAPNLKGQSLQQNICLFCYFSTFAKKASTFNYSCLSLVLEGNFGVDRDSRGRIWTSLHKTEKNAIQHPFLGPRTKDLRRVGC